MTEHAIRLDSRRASPAPDRLMIDALVAQHRALDRAVLAEYARPYPDSLHIRAMKRQKLWIRDRLAILAGDPPPHTD